MVARAMPHRRTQPPRQPPGPSANATEGAPAVLKATVKLFDRQDGEGVNWRMIAETLFKAAFDVLDRLPEDQKRAVARRVHAGAYDRMAGNPTGETGGSTGPGRAAEPSPGADVGSPRPHPPR
jgi:hypothetical protein